MKFKIEMRILNIRNYPLVEEHFEDMASKGWLIHRIIFESIFIYKNIEPEELDFSITPYEVETAFTKKSKKDLKEFQSVCESVGWNYATKSRDLHIYFKEKGSQAVDLETDDEGEFRTIERIAKRQLVGMYFVAAISLFIICFIFFTAFAYVELIKNGLTQLVIPLFPIFLFLSIVEIVKITRFLKINKKNIEIGKEIEYENSKSYFEKLIYLLSFIMIIIYIFYIIYTGIVLKNTSSIMSALPFCLGWTIAGGYSLFIKPSKKDYGTKVIIFIVGFMAIMIILSIINIYSLEGFIGRYNNLNPEEYKVLTADDFEEKEKTYDPSEGKILHDISLLVLKSYEYAYYDKEDRYIKTEYSHVLTEDLGKTLVGQYIKRAKDDSNRYMWSPEFSLEEDKENLWDLDEIYYLNKKKTEILIREGKEVFYLEGKDFSDPDIIELVKNRLEL